MFTRHIDIMTKNPGISVYFSEEEKATIKIQAASKCKQMSEYIKLVILGKLETGCSDIDPAWIEASKKFNIPVKSFINQAINGFGVHALPVKPDEKSLAEIKYLKSKVDKLEREIFELRNKNIKPRTDGELKDLLFNIGDFIRRAGGKYVSLTRIMGEFGISDGLLLQQIAAKLTERGYEYNLRFGFRIKGQMAFKADGYGKQEG